MFHRSARAGWCLAAALAVCFGGCAAPQVDPEAPMPDDFAFTLWMRAADLRATYYELDADGQLRYGGGRQAIHRDPKPIGRLSDAQRRELWDIAVRTGLLAAEDQPFAEARKAQYRFDIDAGRWSRRFRTVDDAAPGAKAFHDAVFEMQAKLNDYRVPGL